MAASLYYWTRDRHFASDVRTGRAHINCGIVALAGLTIAYVADLKVLEGPFLIVAVGLAAVSLVSYGRVAAAARGSASGAPASGSDAAPASGSEASRTGER